jgi:hypothetical protein
MKILTSPSSGSIAGTTFSHNRAGQYTRNRRTPVSGTRTTRQAAVKAQFTQASQSWGSLTDTQQQAWVSYANAHPITDALGQSIKLTGSQFYIKVNAALLNVGASQTFSPPVNSIVNPEVLISLQVDASPFFQIQRTAGTPGDFVAVAVSKATPTGVNFQKTFTQVGAFDAAVEFIDVTTAALAVMGTFAPGTKAWIRLTPVNSDGLTGTPLIAQTRVVAAPTIALPVTTSGTTGTVTATWTGAPATANVWIQTGPTLTGPFGNDDVVDSVTSPRNFSGQTTGQFARNRLQDPVTLLFGPWSTPHVIM